MVSTTHERLSAPDHAADLGAQIAVVVPVLGNGRDAEQHFGYAALRSAGQRAVERLQGCLLYTSPSPRDRTRSRMPSFA